MLDSERTFHRHCLSEEDVSPLAKYPSLSKIQSLHADKFPTNSSYCASCQTKQPIQVKNKAKDMNILYNAYRPKCPQQTLVMFFVEKFSAS